MLTATTFTPDAHHTPDTNALYLCLCQDEGEVYYAVRECFNGHWAVHTEGEEVVAWVELPHEKDLLNALTSRWPCMTPAAKAEGEEGTDLIFS